MASERYGIDPPKPWEILGAFFGFFAVAKDVPAIFRTLGFTALVPAPIKSYILKMNRNPDFWLLGCFSVLTLMLVAFFIPRKREAKENPESDRSEEILRVLRSGKILRALRSLGLTLLREFALDRMGVMIYGTFRRQGDWKPEPQRSKYVDRITFISGSGVEFQYATNCEMVYVRTHPESTDAYGQTDVRVLSSGETWLLLWASNYFPFWYLGYLAKRPFVWTRNLAGAVRRLMG